jgi:hypothetical protein
MPKLSLEDFERCVAERKGEEAYRAALSILGRIDRGFGRIDAVPMRAAAEPGDEAMKLERFSTRFCSALGQLVCDPQITPDPRTMAQFLLYHRWIDLLFAASGFRSSDNFLRTLGVDDEGKGWTLKGDQMLRFLVLFSPRSEFRIELASIMQTNPHMGAIALLDYLGTRYCFTERSHAFREELLEWMPGKLKDVKLGPIVLRNLAEPFMHCSYAQTPRKHEIKADLIAQMRRYLLETGCREMEQPPAPIDGKPVVIVLTEHFSKGHSVYRTHSRSVRALKESFHVVGICPKRAQSPDVESCFDEFLLYPEAEFFEGVKQTVEMILERRPAVVFHLGVGMSDAVIALASLRLAPVQCCSFGHTATTKSPVIDYMILPEDFMGDPDCFTEEMVLLPPEAMPYTPVETIDIETIQKKAAADRKAAGNVVRVGVAASIMKLNPPFFAALNAAAEAAKTPVEFHFFPLAGVGLAHADLKRCLKTRLPTAVVHTEMPYDKYMAALARCEFAISPFPYGNMNSIIDAARLGLPGVCLDGPEAHAHADVAYFSRLGLPPELSAKTVEEYSAVITRLIDDKAWRDHCRAAAAASDLDAGFFQGDERLFCEAMVKLIEHHAETNQRKAG